MDQLLLSISLKPFFFLLAFLIAEAVILFIFSSISISTSSSDIQLVNAALLGFQALQATIQPVMSLIFVFTLTIALYYLTKFIAVKNTKFWQVFKIVAYSRTIAVPYGILSTGIYIILQLANPGSLPSLGGFTGPAAPTPILITAIVISGIITLASAVHIFYAMISGMMLYEKTSFWKSFALILLASIVIFAIIMIISAAIASIMIAIFAGSLVAAA